MERSTETTETTETTEKLGYQKIISALSAVPIFPTLLINLVQSAPHLSLSKQKKDNRLVVLFVATS